MQLRTYQSDIVDKAALMLTSFRKILIQLTTGGGKTVIFSNIAHRFYLKSLAANSVKCKSVLIVVHRKELAAQTKRTLYNAYGITAQMIVAGTKYIPHAPVYIGMIESVNRRMEKLLRAADIGLVIIDECHVAVFNKLHDIFETQKIIGFTATPISSNKKNPLKNYYEEILVGPSIKELIQDNYLAQNITRAPKDVVDRKKLAVLAGEFDERLMAIEYSKPKYIYNTVEAYERWCKGKKTIIFNVNISHNMEVCKAFIEAGYNAKTVDSENVSDKERDAIFGWFKTTEDAILLNVGIATTGYDEPTIRCVLVNKSVMGLNLWLQMTGRGGRVTEQKSMFDIIDMGGNAITHGDWSDERDWKKIFHNPPKPAEKGVAPCKACPKCEGIVSASTRICPLMDERGELCGYVFPIKAPAPEEELQDFVIVTKGINIKAIIESNELKSEYYSFYKAGNELVENAKNTITAMSNDTFNFILLRYFELIKEWAKTYQKKNKDNPDKLKSIRYNQWHKNKAKEHLINKLKIEYPKWQI